MTRRQAAATARCGTCLALVRYGQQPDGTWKPYDVPSGEPHNCADHLPGRTA